MKNYIIFLNFILIGAIAGQISYSNAGDNDNHGMVKMEYPADANGDVFRRMQESGFDFSIPHDVEFFAVFRTEEMAKSVELQYLSDHKAGEKLKKIETRPAESGGMELYIVKTMLVTYENVTSFEDKLAERVSKQDGYLDGWGVLQQ